MNICLRRFAVFLLALVSHANASQVVFSEVMYRPLAGKPEFIEVQNLTVTPLDMARWSFDEGVTLQLPDFNPGSPQAHLLLPNERILVSSATDAATRAAYPGIPAGVRIFGPWTGALDNDGEKITLRDKNGVVVTTLDYGDSGKWPVQADGPGHSLVLNDPNRDPDDWRVWRASTNRNGSPGIADPAPPATLALNEFHFAANGHVDWVEFRNNSLTTTISSVGLFVASLDDFSNKVALGGNFTPGSEASISVDFASDNNGDITLYLVDSSNNVRDAVKVRRKTGRDTWQQFPAGSREWYSATTDTRDAENNPARNTDIVINEIMADPPSNQRDGEFIELYNRAAGPVNVGGWKLDDAVDLTIPAGTIIPAGGYLVLCANSAYLNASYPGLTALGNWSGSLGNKGDRIRLEDADGNLANQVDYRFGGEWPELASGNGSSLELAHPFANNALGTAWRDSDESTKSAFTPFTVNLGTYSDVTQGATNDDELLMWLVGDGHVILNNITLRPTSGSGNLFTNGEVTTLNNDNLAGWQSRGNHWQCFSDASGVHMVATGGGDNKCNHMEKDASTASGTGLLAGTQYTLTFNARWVYGKPRIVAQTWDLSMGGTALVPIPLNLGTPGATNSRLLPEPPAQISALAHSPIVPPTGSTMTITARVSSSHPLTNVTLFHRLDNIDANAAWNQTVMTDNGTAGDAIAGDGVYTARFPLSTFTNYNVASSIVQFYVSATTSTGQITTLPRSGQSAPGMWVCDNQSVGTDLRRMRVVISAYWGDALNQSSGTGGHTVKFNYKFPKLASEYFPCTFIINDEVYYDAGVHKTGSPFTRSTGNSLDRARVELPGDHEFRGKSKIYWDNDGAGSTMLHNRILRYWLYLCGVPGNENEVCRVTKNNTGFAIRESNEVFDKDMLDRIWENGSDGFWYEMDDRFWIADDGSTRLGNDNATFDYKATDSQGAENPTAYHNQFVPNSREVEYDYSPLIGWCKQIEQNTTMTIEQLERMADVSRMAAYGAVRGYAADWDNITMGRGKNGYFFQRPSDRRFSWQHWDSDNALQTSHINDSIIGTLTNVGTNTPGFFSKPYVRRHLNYLLNQMITTYASNGPRLSAWLAAEEAASNSFTVPATYVNWHNATSTSGIIQTRAQAIQTFIGTTSLNATFAVTTPTQGANVATSTVDAVGTAPLNAFRVICVGHPEAVFSWTTNSTADVSPWKLAGVQLANGANVLTFRTVDEYGNQVGSDIVRTVNGTSNSAPVMALNVDPSSQNVSLGQVVTVDSSASYDPENAAPLAFSWTVAPATGFTTTVISSTRRQFIFTTPGNYSVSVQGTDAAALSASASRVLSVFNSADRDDFGGDYLNGFSVQNMELRDNYSPDAWYSLNEESGALSIQISNRAAKPLNVGTPAFPNITRALPASTDFALQTNLSYTNPQFGSYFAGLFVQTTENGNPNRYVFGLEGGTVLRAYLSANGGAYSSLGSVTYTGTDLTLRVLRSGANLLLFQHRVNGVWTTIVTRVLASGSTASTGGLFVSTNAVQSVRAAFDYLLVTDPGNSTNLVNNLRITEIMYNPNGSGGVEFVELQNIGAAPINLQGAYFEDGTPFSSRFTFGDLTLQPGKFCVVTNDSAGFATLYGPNVTIAGQYAGSLNNDGERITLKDPAGNIVLDFTYGDVAPWPTAPDGTGKSLEVTNLNPALYGDGSNWHAGNETSGSPGYTGLAIDSDFDGAPDAIELAYGTDPNDGASQPIVPGLERNLANGAVTLTWESEAGRTYTVQWREVWTGNWQNLNSVIANGATATYLDNAAIGQPARYYRVTTQLP